MISTCGDPVPGTGRLPRGAAARIGRFTFVAGCNSRLLSGGAASTVWCLDTGRLSEVDAAGVSIYIHFDGHMQKSFGKGETSCRCALRSLDVNLEKSNPNGEITMRCMVIVKATKESEAGVLPSTELLTAMGKFNEELVKAGVMLAGEGLQPSSKAKRVRFSGQTRTVTDGPFTETKELIAGFWLWQVRSMEEAVEWVKRCPNPMMSESEIEIRPVFEAEDFGAEFTPELREQEERLRSRSRAKNNFRDVSISQLVIRCFYRAGGTRHPGN